MSQPVTKQSVAYRWAGTNAPRNCGKCRRFVPGQQSPGSPHVTGTCHDALKPDENGSPQGEVHVLGIIEDNHVCVDWEARLAGTHAA